MPWVNQGNWQMWMPLASTSVTSPIYLTTTANTTLYSQMSNITFTSTNPILWTTMNYRNTVIPNPIAVEITPNRPEPRVVSARSAAVDKAHELLLRHLDRTQRNDYDNHGCFTAISRSGQHYRIRCDSITANIQRIYDREVFCIHCGDLTLPMFDHILAQKLMIENDEEGFLAIANRHGRR